MPTYLEQVRPNLDSYRIFIIEQTDDGAKFNRGKLLNVGYTLAKAEGFNAFALHDVDLLPQNDLLAWYSVVPLHPLHIAWVWDDVSGFGSGYATYVGGAMSLVSDERNSSSYIHALILSHPVLSTERRAHGAHEWLPQQLLGLGWRR